ncbi:MAG TPA: HPF/RaiA family ribosome-associated protein [Opitutus sp.]|nr:HPF/RaiA family ribosome-associated protein [Opitutus sp.]
MKILLRPGNVRSSRFIEAFAQSRLSGLAGRQRIDEAIIQLHEEREASPRFFVTILLRLPGPDIHASARDHTAGVALRKALDSVESQIETRHGRRRWRWRAQRPLRGFAPAR